MSIEQKLNAEAKPVEDISDPEVQRRRLLDQEPKLLEAVGLLAARIHATPADPAYPEMTPQALIVGGFVRDSLLGKHPKDADLEVSGLSVERLESLLMQLFPGRVDLVGRSFGIYKVFVEDGLDFDISIPRRESKTGTGHKGFTIEGDPTMSIEDAARRRDFTFNALAADPLSGKVYDYFGGVQDLKDKTLRVTDTERFQDDPLRVYRALQFAARMELTVDPESLELMKHMVQTDEFAQLPRERISGEFEKLFEKSDKPSVGFELARELGIIERYFPELNALIGVAQEPEWHPEGDVWIHTMMVVDEAARLVRQPERELIQDEKLQVIFGALCHDLGKPSTTEMIDGRLRSLGHEEAGEEPAKALAARFSFSDATNKAAATVAREHLKPAVLHRALTKPKPELNERQYANAVRKLIKRISPLSWKVLIACSEADSRGRTLPGAQTNPYLPGEVFTKTILEERLDVEGTKDLVQGRDIQALALELGKMLKPGRIFGELTREIEALRDAGTIKTREEALESLKERIRQLT